MKPNTVATLRVGTAAVWLVFGLGFKVFDIVPRHRLIVAAMVGDAAAGPTTIAIGAAEALMGVWILTAWRPRTCAAAQSLAITIMNGLELTRARELLLAPVAMVCANAAFLGLGWYCALHPRAPRKPA